MKEFLIYLAGVITSSIGYLIKRKMEKSSILADLEIQLKLLEINKQMKEQNVSDEELRKMRERISGGKSISSQIKEFAEGPPEFMTQADMYDYAQKEYHILEKDLDTTVKILSSDRDEAWKKELHQSQLAWLEYRNKQAQLASDQYKGGSIAPFIYITETNTMTRSRIAELRLLLIP
jgi:uncharacterized protein YecT (DUF1311 family)